MINVFLCIATEHDWRMVLVAALVCAVATVATFFLYSRVPGFPMWRRWAWLAMTGLVAGSGIWTTHFVAMLAFKTGLPTGYAALPTMGSLGVAVLSTTLGFAVGSAAVAEGRRPAAAIGGGVLVGLGITFMHYVGMSGYRTTGVLQWDMAYVWASVLIGAAFAGAALYVSHPGSGWRRQASAAGLLTLGIVGMHFTGMTAVTIVPDFDIPVPASMMSDPMMVAISVAVTGLILITAIGGVAFDTASRNGNLRRLREALDVMPEGLAFYDASDRLVAWNTQYADLCGLGGVDPYAGMPFSHLLETSVVHGVYPDAIGREAEWLDERKAARWGDTPSLTQQTAAGRWLRITERRTGDGGTVSVSVDITDLKRAEAEMAQARDRAEELARRAEVAETVAGLGNWRLDPLTREVTWSAQMYRIYGVDPDMPLDLEALMGMTHPDDAGEAAARLKGMLSGQSDENSITRIVRSDGDVRYLEGNSRVERGPAGEITAVIGTIVDVTDQKTLEARLRLAQEEAEAAAAVKGEFLANMSHELRTPLTSIIGFTRLAAEQADLTDLTRAYVERVGDASRALLCTVNDILDFSKLEAGQVSIQVEPVSLARLGRSTLDLFTPQAGAKDLGLTLDGDDLGEDLVIAVDPDRVRQVLLNLVSNAVKFTTTGGVTLQMRYDPAAAVLTVAVIDTGDGIPPDKLDRLFKRFSQVDGTLTRVQGGTGLGLAICKGLVEAMGGEIGVESRVGQGSRFWFSIPAARATLAEAGPEGGMAEPAMVTGVRVLVADDHPTNRELARLYLAGVGAEVTEAGDGEEAVQLASEWPFDVILMDLRMPRLDGEEALRRIRAVPGPNDATPILAFTADADTDAHERLRAVGFQEVVAKPVEPGALIAAVARATAFEEEPASEHANVA
ncbi:ATP-binding protein [Brevundimonas sp.]|uniref:ATP-binding protein n=1 Tax=Brevundimonas sp. TaxID=1871086 RepID=UPI00273793B5|nr:ATP-binding protein [Brevundimonas sp.]MDP3801404.1 ATP-binding protein [Brevundimonas sp.]